MRGRRPGALEALLIGATATLFTVAHVRDGRMGAEAVSSLPLAYVTAAATPVDTAANRARAGGEVVEAVTAFEHIGPGLSHPRALEDAFHAYYNYKAEHADQVRKPYLYFVDYGQPSTARRGYVFDMEKLEVIEGPFTVAHGRGSASPSELVPTRFSNVPGSFATSLGLYLAQETYTFGGKAGGRLYSSVGLRLKGLSEGFNDNARERRVVAHGAPYVTASRAGRSEGCPAMEEERARRLLPRLANGGMVFLFAPDNRWLASDRWLARAGDEG
jgi:hypothetical protein